MMGAFPGSRCGQLPLRWDGILAAVPAWATSKRGTTARSEEAVHRIAAVRGNAAPPDAVDSIRSAVHEFCSTWERLLVAAGHVPDAATSSAAAVRQVLLILSRLRPEDGEIVEFVMSQLAIELRRRPDDPFGVAKRFIGALRMPEAGTAPTRRRRRRRSAAQLKIDVVAALTADGSASSAALYAAVGGNRVAFYKALEALRQEGEVVRGARGWRLGHGS